MKSALIVLAVLISFLGIVMLRWPRRDIGGVFLGLKWREIIGFALIGVALLLGWLQKNL